MPGHDVVVPRNELDSEDEPEWSWDPTLYAGSAAHYAAGRVTYPAEVVEVLVSALRLDGSGWLLDVGCGPGSLTLLLAPHFEQAIGVDADADMLSEAAGWRRTSRWPMSCGDTCAARTFQPTCHRGG